MLLRRLVARRKGAMGGFKVPSWRYLSPEEIRRHQSKQIQAMPKSKSKSASVPTSCINGMGA